MFKKPIKINIKTNTNICYRKMSRDVRLLCIIFFLIKRDNLVRRAIAIRILSRLALSNLFLVVFLT